MPQQTECTTTFINNLNNPQHALYKLLLDRRHQLTYTSWHRWHDLTLSRGSHRLSDYNIIVRLLFKDSYWFLVMTTSTLNFVKLHLDSFLNKIILSCIVLYHIKTVFYHMKDSMTWRHGQWADRQWFSYSLDCKAVATRRIPDTYKPKPNPYLNANPNPNPNPNPTNPTSILSKFSRKNFTLHTV